MTEASLRDMGGSRDSLRQAIGRLDATAPTPAARASAAKVRPPVARPAGRWIFLLILLAVSAAGVASLLAT